MEWRRLRRGEYESGSYKVVSSARDCAPAIRPSGWSGWLGDECLCGGKTMKEVMAVVERIAAKIEGIRVHIRWMIARDMPEVTTADWLSFSEAWSEEEFRVHLRQRNCIGMVAEHGENIVGFMIYELHKHKLHVLRFAVHPDWRRRGIGKQMVDKLLPKLSSHRRTRITIDVDERTDAPMFFRSQGFSAVRVIRDAFDGADAYRMVFRFKAMQPAEGE